MQFIHNLIQLLRPFRLQVQLLSGFAHLPTRNSKYAAGYDLYTPIPLRFEPGTQLTVPLGFATAFTPGWGAMIWDRSGMGSKGFCRHAGLLDSDYRGEWAVILRNHSDQRHEFQPGDRIAQVVFSRVAQEPVEVVAQLPDTIRGQGGFGSTGR